MAEQETRSPMDLSSMYVEVEGEYLPKIFETNRPMKEQVECIKALEMRHDDVIVMAYMKSGTHWVWEIASMLILGKAEYMKRDKAFVMLEAVEIEKVQAEASPRVLNSHLPPRLLPRQIKEKKVKVVHVYRNFKDALVSSYFHILQTPIGHKELNLEHVMQLAFSSEVPAGSKYIKFLDEMDEFHKENPDVPFFLTSFEDIKEDPEKVIRQMAEFLGVEASPDLVKEIAEATTINKMREANKQKKQCKLSLVNIYRKGEVGDWKNHLTVSQSERVDAELTKLKSRAYHFRYQL